jgi:hypothetical protein
MKSYILIILFIIFSSCDKKEMKIPDELKAINRNKSIGTGINLGNALEAPNEGEWGSIIYCDHESRLTWTEFVHQQIEESGFSSTYFDFGVYFRAYDLENDHWIDGFLSALLGD